MKESDEVRANASSEGPFPGIAETALRSFGVVPAQIDFIAHSENAAFRVTPTEGDRTYVLRVHYPVSEHFPPDWRWRERIDSEVEWLNALRRDTDLIVPQPVRNKDGGWVTQLWREEVPEPLNCTLLIWIDGRFVRTPPTAKQTTQIGELVAGIHEHGALWTRPRGFARHQHDFRVIEEDMARLKEAAANGLIDDPDFLLLEKAAECLYETIQELGKESDAWGLIHADVCGANILVTPKGEVGLIDFSSCAFGHFAADLAAPILHLAGRNTAVSSALLKGYKSVRALPPEPEITIPAFVVGRMIDTLAFAASRPEKHEKMKQHLLPYTVAYCEDMLEGKIALFEKGGGQ